ncbi:MAG: DUF4407 domain-containing protein [Flavobacterium sp.]|jgi:hypothetical protein
MLKRFFILCSGADQDILKTCSNGEQNKFAGIGATVFFTAVMAFLAGSYALFTVFDSHVIAAVFGFIWGLLIFNLDRFIVSTIRKKDIFMKEFWQAFPRIILAIIIAIVISKPLEIKIFEKEINAVLLKEKNKMAMTNKKEVSNYFNIDLEKNKASIDSLKSQITKKEKEVNDLYAVFIAEAEGTAGTKKLGKGPVYKEKREKHDRAIKQLDSIKKANAIIIKEKEDKNKKINEDLEKKINETQPIIDGFDGLMARINALNKLPWLPSMFIMLLFLAIETSPIFTKLMSNKSEYDFKLEGQEMDIQSILNQNKFQLDLHRNTDASIYEVIYEELKIDKEIHQYKKQKAKELLLLQANLFAQKQKNIMEK